MASAELLRRRNGGPALSLALLAPFASVIVARLGRKRLLMVATVLYAVFSTTPLPGIIAGRALVGVTEAAILTCCTSCSPSTPAACANWPGLRGT